MEEVIVNITELRQKGVWHFQPYSRTANDILVLLGKSRFPVRNLGTLLREKIGNGYLTIGSNAEEGIPLLSIKDLSENGINLDRVRYITLEEHKKLVETQVQRGDVVVKLTSKPGISAVYESDKPLNLSRHLARLRLTNDIDAHYLVYYLNSEIGQALISSSAIGSVQPKLTVKALMNLPVILPPLDIQKRIAVRAQTLEQEAATLMEVAEQRKAEAHDIASELFGRE